MNFLSVSFVFLLNLSLHATQELPCPRTFLFETEKAEKDRWYGVITLNSRYHLKGVTLQINFDKSIIQLGNYLGGHVISNPDNTVFTIKNDKMEIKENTTVQARIYVVYDSYYDNPPPQITKITFNGKEICPKYMEEDISNFNNNVAVNISVPQCGTTSVTTNSLLTNGHNTSSGQYPWHAALYILPTRKISLEYICGGTLISEKHVITAAHYITEPGTVKPRDPNSVVIILGKYDIMNTGTFEQTMIASKIIVHPEFNRTDFHNDISIIELATKPQITDYVRPICLWSEDTRLDQIVNRIGFSVGWALDHRGKRVTNLQQITMPVLSTLDCIYSNRDFFSIFLNGKNFCAGYRNGTSLCNGDGGGALVFPKTGTSGITVWQLRGIASNAVAKADGLCDPSYPVIFTDIAQYLDWIQQSTT